MLRYTRRLGTNFLHVPGFVNNRVHTSHSLCLRYSSAVSVQNKSSNLQDQNDVKVPRPNHKQLTKDNKGRKALEGTPAGSASELSVLEQNLAIASKISRIESAVHKLARFSSRLHDATIRRDELRELLKKLASEMDVEKDRSHPIVQCCHILRTTAFLPLRGTIDAIKSRTPKDQIGLPQEQADSVRFEARISEMQMRIVKRLLGGFWVQRKEGKELPNPVKVMLRSARGQARYIHRMIADSMEDFDLLAEDEWSLDRKAKAGGAKVERYSVNIPRQDEQ